MVASADISSSSSGPTPLPPWAFRHALVWAVAAAACFHVAHLVPYAGLAIVAFFLCLLQLTRVDNARHAFRWGVGLGWLVYIPHLAFFWNIFVPEGTGIGKVVGVCAVLALWTVLPIWLGLFLCLATWLRRWTQPKWWIWLIPVLWTGLEYFRSELYPLKFSWLSAGYAFAESPWMVPLNLLGLYGIGFLLFLLAALVSWGWRKSKLGAGLMLIGVPYALIFTVVAISGRLEEGSAPRQLRIGGVQLEFPSNKEILEHLDQLIAEHPDTQLCVLSEYTFNGPVPQVVRDWCRENERYLIAGGKDPLGKTNFYNTAFVVGADGEIVFKQIKSVPIQFFADGLPAPAQQVWNSPWGKIGLCICYDLGYSRVTDELVRQGAQAIIAPTMDVEGWGAYQHWLHSRVAPVRAAEYGIPIFRLTSSGISQHVEAHGKVVDSRTYPGQGEILTAKLELTRSGSHPWDRWLAPICVLVTGATALFASITSTRRWCANQRHP